MKRRDLVARNEDSSAVMAEICSVRLAKTLFGIPISHILEIVGGARPQPVLLRLPTWAASFITAAMCLPR